MRFFGSAMRYPHVQGGFRGRLVAAARQCVPVGDNASVGEAAMSEPLAVALHAVAQAARGRGPPRPDHGLRADRGRRRCSPRSTRGRGGRGDGHRGRAAGDRAPPGRRGRGERRGGPAALAPEEKDKGQFDLALECSGNPRALAQSIASVRPRGTIVQVGVGGSFDVPMNAVVAKELRLAGSFRFGPEFAQAAGLIGRGRSTSAP